MLRNWLEKYIVRWAVEKFTLENLQTILIRCVAYLRVKAAETETEIDDFGVEILEGIVNDTEKLKLLYNWLRSFIEKGICGANPTLDQETELIRDLQLADCDKCKCSTIPANVYEAVLNMVIPTLIAWWRSNNK